MDPTSGSIRFDGEEIGTASGARLKELRRGMQMIFQDPYSSLNPRKTVGTIIAEPFVIHNMLPGQGERKRTVQDLMDRVGLNPEHYNRYPHEFSGGQRQRIGVARALALKPSVIVADEPVSALDVSIQAQILNLLRELQRDMGITLIFIAHDLSVVRHMCDRIAVMYLGRIVEHGDQRAAVRAPADALHRRADVGGAGARSRGWRRPRSARSWPATCRRPPTRLRRAGSTRAAGRRRRSAARTTRRSSRRTAATSPPATSRSPTPRSSSGCRRRATCRARAAGLRAGRSSSRCRRRRGDCAACAAACRARRCRGTPRAAGSRARR